MSKVVVYWSQTGNTEQMANILADALGCKATDWADFSFFSVADYDAMAFGCPSRSPWDYLAGCRNRDPATSTRPS